MMTGEPKRYDLEYFELPEFCVIRPELGEDWEAKLKEIWEEEESHPLG